jgi:hypothetical protein
VRVEDARRLATVHPTLVAGHIEVCHRFAERYPGERLGCVDGYRTEEVQMAAFTSGLSLADGSMRFSFHQFFPSRALDFAILDPDEKPDGYVRDGEDPRYRWVAEQFESLGFGWGGRWTKPDWDHIYMPGAGPDRDSVVDSHAAWVRTVETAPFLRA